MKRIAVVMIALFVLALAMLIGSRISQDAMAVVVGVVCGIGASIPVSLLMVYLVTHRNDAPAPDPPAAHPTYYIETMNMLSLPGEVRRTRDLPYLMIMPRERE